MPADLSDNLPESQLRSSRLVLVAVPVLLTVAILLGSPNFRFSSGRDAEPFGGDFIQEWTGGWMLWNGDTSRFYETAYISSIEHDPSLIGFEWDTDGYLPMVYPPFWYLLVSPFSKLPLPVGAVLWTWLMTGALVGALWLMQRWLSSDVCHGNVSHAEAGRHAISSDGWNSRGRQAGMLLFAIALFVYAPLIESLGSGQKGTLLLLLFTATFVMLDRKRPFAAGLVFGLVAFKPQLTLVIGFAMLFKRQWRFIAGGVTMGAMLVGLSFVAGTDLCRQFFQLCSGMGDYVQTGGYDLHKAHCWWGACQLLLDGAPSWLITSCATVGSLLTIGLLSATLRGRVQYGTGEFARQFAALTVATLLLSPHLFTYDLTLLLLPIFLLTIGPGALDAQWKWMPIAIFVIAGQSAAISQTTGVQLSVLAMLGLLGTIAASRQTEEAPAVSATLAEFSPRV